MGECFLYKRGHGGGGGGSGGSVVEVIKTAVGFAITLIDSSAKPLLGLRIFGKTTQNGTPTPDAPVPLESVGDSGSITVNVGISETDENLQTLTISTPNGLPGIPVTSGGNYTDENGQQWICDEVDFVSGKYVQRVAKLVLDGSDEIVWSIYGGTNLYNNDLTNDCKKYGSVAICGLCNKIQRRADGKILTSIVSHCKADSGLEFKDVVTNWGISECTPSAFDAYIAESPIVFIYELETPIEKSLSAEELAQYAALHTNYPNTTIFNDGGAHMEVKYIAIGG